MADPDGKEMFLQLLSALKDDVALKASTSSRASLGQDRGLHGSRNWWIFFKSLLVLPVIYV